MKLAHLCDDENGTLMYNCPGCDSFHGAATKKPNNCGAQWDFNGNEESPTLSPSVNVQHKLKDGETKFVCHHFIKDGMIEFCGDCTHQLAGRTVPIPPWDEYE